VGAGKFGAVIFLAAMLAGMLAFNLFDARRTIRGNADAR
jgi:hypothetical protein